MAGIVSRITICENAKACFSQCMAALCAELQYVEM